MLQHEHLSLNVGRPTLELFSSSSLSSLYSRYQSNTIVRLTFLFGSRSMNLKVSVGVIPAFAQYFITERCSVRNDVGVLTIAPVEG